MSTAVTESQAGASPPPAAPGAPPPAEAPPVADPACPNCGAPLAPGQEWCLECGVGAPGSLGQRPGWHTAAAIIAATVLLAAGAVAASYAALSKSSKKVVTRPATVAQVPPATTPVAPGTTPATPPPTSIKPGTTPTPPISHVTPTPAPAVTTPAAPATHAPTPTPAPAPAPSTPAATSAPTATTHHTSTVSPKSAAGSPGSPVVLDPDAASTYNPYGYPDTRFGDPSLAIDQDPSTDWSAQVDPAAAPRNATGLILDLKSPQRLSRLKLQTVTPGMEVEIYGANGDQPPPSITDPAWHHLSAPHTVPRTMTFKLVTGGQQFRFIVLWITKAPSSSSTAKMAVNEVTLYH